VKQAQIGVREHTCTNEFARRRWSRYERPATGCCSRRRVAACAVDHDVLVASNLLKDAVQPFKVEDTGAGTCGSLYA